MIKTFLAAGVVAFAGSAAAFAQGFSGGSVGIEYSEFDDLTVYEKTTFRAALEYGLTPVIAIGGNLSYYSFADADNLDLVNLTLHGIYDLNSEISVGLWFSRESLDSSSNNLEIDNYGVEAAYNAGPVSAQGYFGVGEVEDTDLTYFGLDGNYAFGNGVSVIGSYEIVSIEETTEQDYSTFELGAAYTLASGPAFFAKVGNLMFEDSVISDNEVYYAIGATYEFGGDRGTTFGTRGFLELPFVFGG
ncbi:hypothetical protein [Yoonia vestfoldensis]|uniref:hypothetical protein n=1 Tax=Yoonia vestfoldensis TaxID=245188 RepID=UPI00035F5BE4|nr:hypothetical protein [Yoonia vestfoldensis]